MKKRYLYSLLFGVPGFFAALMIAFLLFGMTAGVLWVFVFGDAPWPPYADKLLPGLFASAFLVAWTVFIALGFVTGRRLEKDPHTNTRHILVSSGLTLTFLLLIVIQQFRVGNLGPRSDSVLCSDYCALNGYTGSGLPPRDSGDRTCSCYDDFGNEILKIPLDRIEFETSK